MAELRAIDITIIVEAQFPDSQWVGKDGVGSWTSQEAAEVAYKRESGHPISQSGTYKTFNITYNQLK